MKLRATPAIPGPLLITPGLDLLLPHLLGSHLIRLPPLPKALYLFFLTQPPAGLSLPDLVDHQPALLAWYQRLQPQLDAATAQLRIRELTDLRLNSLHEKFSRIKAAFTQVLPARLAQQYYIRGERGGTKGVALPRHLVQWQ